MIGANKNPHVNNFLEFSMLQFPARFVLFFMYLKEYPTIVACKQKEIAGNNTRSNWEILRIFATSKCKYVLLGLTECSSEFTAYVGQNCRKFNWRYLPAPLGVLCICVCVCPQFFFISYYVHLHETHLSQIHLVLLGIKNSELGQQDVIIGKKPCKPNNSRLIPRVHVGKIKWTRLGCPLTLHEHCGTCACSHSNIIHRKQYK